MTVGRAEEAKPRRPLGPTRLRPRLVLTFALVAAVTALAVAGTSYALVRRAVLDRQRVDAVQESRRNLQEAADRLGPSPDAAELRALNDRLLLRGGFDVVAVAEDGSFETTSVSLSATSVPDVLARPVAAGRVASTRAEAGGRPFLVVGGRLLPRGPAFYYFFPLAEVYEDLTLLRNVLAGVSGVLVVLSAGVGAVAARGLLRPIRRARRAVHDLEVGLLQTRLPTRGRDELADLARSFNRMAEALERTVGDLRSLEAAQRRFVSDGSHELRTPLTALTTAADVLEATAAGLNDQGRRAARLLVLESRRLATLVEDLMEISRVDAGVATIAWERVDVATSVSGALRSQSWAGRVELAATDEAVTFADPRRLDTIVANLVGNALHHGQPPVRVTVSASPTAVRVDVTDAGEGIPAAHLPHLFDRFYKVDSSRPRSAGSGLGLAIARENARLHGGDISVTSQPGRGTTFTLTLPRRHAAPDSDETPTAVTAPLPTSDLPVTRPGHDQPGAPTGRTGR